MRYTFLRQESPLYNVEHDHLNSALLGVLWTNVDLIIRGSKKDAITMLPVGMGSCVDRALRSVQMLAWFGTMPDFLIIFNAFSAIGSSDRQFCRLSDHELTHCGQKMKDGFPDFDKETCKPKFAMRPHDRELFDSEIRRWGARSVLGNTTVDIIRAVEEEPEIPDIDIAQMCGTCALR